MPQNTLSRTLSHTKFDSLSVRDKGSIGPVEAQSGL